MKMGDRYTARMYDAGTTDEWKKMIWLATHNNRPNPPLVGVLAFTVALVFHMPRPKFHFRTNGCLKPTSPTFHVGRPDLDNLAKAALDAITDAKFFWSDDGAVSDLHLSKVYSLCPGMHVTITAQ